jgi:uncharacterized membrane protein
MTRNTVREFISSNAFLLTVTILLSVSYGWMFVAFGDELFAADLSIITFFELLGEHWYTLLPAFPLIPFLGRPPDVF